MAATEPRFDPIERKTVSAEIRNAIAASIHRREFLPGSQLPPERVLTQQFGVGRTSVREAIQSLVTLGLVEKRNNRTYVVEHLPSIMLDGGDRRKQRVRELFEVRQAVEIPIARLAACRATDEQRREIARIAGEFRDNMSLEEFRRLDRVFHWAVARGCGNATLAELYGKVLESLFDSAEFAELLSARSNRRVVREVIQSSSRAHRAIAESIQRSDWQAVMEAAEGHLADVESQMISRMV
jgi:GntR family transcriptional repressor for pyruvate dehydrogenase complex